MKLRLIAIFLIAVLLTFSCKKDEISEENQLLINKMEAACDSIVNNTEVPGIVALVFDNTKDINWIYETGVSDIENNLPTDIDHTFRIGSNTKTMTGTVLLQLVDEGLISLDDLLSDYYPDFPRADEVNISMLCNMTSGIFNYSELDLFSEILEANPGKVWEPQELVDLAIELDTVYYFDPGNGFHYSNTNTIILGMIIEEITGNSLEYEINNRIIESLGLTNTAFLTSGTNLPGNHGKGYFMGTDVTELFDISWGWAAGSAYSTPNELQKYVKALVEGDFLSDGLQDVRLTDINVLGDKLGYGLCILKRGSFLGHNGGLPGYTSTMLHSPDKDCSVIIYYNIQSEHESPDGLFYIFADILYGDNY